MTDSGSQQATLYGAWTWRRSLLKSDLPATTKHVLLTLSCHVPEIGGAAFPSPATLAAESSLNEKTVRSHLKEGVAAGWIQKFERFTDSGRQTTNGYHLTLPGGGGNMRGTSPSNGEGRGEREYPLEGGTRVPPHKSSYEKLRGDDAPAAIEGDLFEDDGANPVAVAIGGFLKRTGARWRLKSTITEWAQQIGGEAQYAGLNLPYQIQRAGEWWESAIASGKRKKPPKQPDQAIRTWLRNAASDLPEGEGDGGEDWIDKITADAEEAGWEL